MLGMTRDSYLDLAELAKEKEESRSEEQNLSREEGSESRPEEPPSYAASPSTEGLEVSVKLAALESDDASASSHPDDDIEHCVANFPLNSEEEKKDGSGDGIDNNNNNDSPTYRGFDYDYSEYESYENYGAYGNDFVLGGMKQREDSFWCCLFPSWFASNSIRIDPDGTLEEVVGQPLDATDNNNNKRTTAPHEEDERSTGSDAFGEKLSDKDKKAVLARLRLADPDSTANGVAAVTTSGTGDTTTEGASGGVVVGGGAITQTNEEVPPIRNGGLLNRIPPYDISGDLAGSSTGPKGILRRTSKIKPSSATSASTPLPGGGSSLDSQGLSKSRRSLFPVYEKDHKEKKTVDFANMARVISIRSVNDMTEEEKGDVWWQRCDYDDFRKTARLITKAIMHAGSEIWLSTQLSTTPNGSSNKNSNVSDEADESTSDKWWHKFGHSRRGLEHIASMEEGKERQQNCQAAVHAVIEEQRRLRMGKKGMDNEKLRSVSIQHTAWARDLALASGASDADAVRRNFGDKRRSREFYLIKMSRGNPNAARKYYGKLPSFMQPIFGLQMPVTIGSQLDVRRAQQQQQSQHKNATPPPRDTTAITKEQKGSNVTSSSSTSTTTNIEPIRDPPKSTKKESIAKRAAGFSHEGAEQVSMSAVLCGMGSVPKEAPAVGAS